jgi:hypothetical protein
MATKFVPNRVFSQLRLIIRIADNYAPAQLWLTGLTRILSTLCEFGADRGPPFNCHFDDRAHRLLIKKSFQYPQYPRSHAHESILPSADDIARWDASVGLCGLA